VLIVVASSKIVVLGLLAASLLGLVELDPEKGAGVVVHAEIAAAH
jgi:hypothetical protein